MDIAINIYGGGAKYKLAAELGGVLAAVTWRY